MLMRTTGRPDLDHRRFSGLRRLVCWRISTGRGLGDHGFDRFLDCGLQRGFRQNRLVTRRLDRRGRLGGFFFDYVRLRFGSGGFDVDRRGRGRRLIAGLFDSQNRFL